MEKDLRLKLLGPNMCQRVLTQPERTMNGSRDEAFTSEVKLFLSIVAFTKNTSASGIRANRRMLH